MGFLPVLKINKKEYQADPRFKNTSVIVLKLTNGCNISCGYCYENIRKNYHRMRLETFRNIIYKVFSNTRSNKLGIYFHGGEPLLMDVKWLCKACLYIREQSAAFNKDAKIILQTNLTIINEEIIEFIKRFNVQVSASIDGTAGITGLLRPWAGTAEFNFLRLRENNINPSVLMTINASNYMYFREILDYLECELNLDSFKANIVYPAGKAAGIPRLEPNRIFQAQKTIIDYMIDTQGKRVLEHNICEEILRFSATEDEIKRFPINVHMERPCGAGTKVLSFTPYGDILPCGRLPWDMKSSYMGSISDDNYERFEQSKSDFHGILPSYISECGECPAKPVCDTGCQAFVIQSDNKENIGCLPTKLRFRYYESNFASLIPVLDSIRSREEYKFSGNIPFAKTGTFKNCEEA